MCETRVANLWTTIAALSKLSSLVELRFQKWICCNDSAFPSASSGGNLEDQPDVRELLTDIDEESYLNQGTDEATGNVFSFDNIATGQQVQSMMEDSSDDNEVDFSSYWQEFVGIVAEHADRADVKSIAIPGYWILKKGSKWSPEHDKARKDEKVMLYFHGGAFVTGTAYPSHPTAMIPNASLKYCASLSRVLSVDYRLSSGPPEPRNPFPCAVVDAIAAYKYLVCEMGFTPQNITVGGDSAGGNIALAFTRYVVESKLPHLPPPGGLIAASPVTDMSFSRADTNSSHCHNAASDIFDLRPNVHPSSAGKPSIRAYIGEMDPEEMKYNRYLSPASKFAIPPNVGDAKLFFGFPRTYVMGGGAEHLFDDIVALAEQMKEDGVDVTTDFPPDAVHGYFIFGWHEPERTESLVKCAAWLDDSPGATGIVE